MTTASVAGTTGVPLTFRAQLQWHAMPGVPASEASAR